MAELEKWLTDTQPTADPAMPTAPAAPIDAPDDSAVMRWFSGAQDTAQLKTSVQAGVATPPDTAARTLKLQAKTGLPVDLISRNLDTIEADTARADFDADKYRKENPIVSGWLAQHPDHAAVAQDDYEALSTIERTVNALSRGVAALSQQGSAMKLAGDARVLDRYTELERRAAAGEDLSKISPHEDPDSLRYRIGRPEGADLKLRLTDSVQTSVKNIIEKQAKIRSIPQDANIANALSAESFSDFWYWFSRNPTGFIGLVGVESLPQAVPAMGLAVAGGLTAGPPGAIAGLGAGSFATDYAASTIQALQEEGVDFQDPQALQRAFADKELMNRVGSRAFRHAAPVAAFDALSGGVAGKMLTPAIKKPLLREGANVAVQAPVQGALGAAGEATGQLASGGDLQAGQIMAEFFGEFAQTPVEVASVAGGRVVESLREALRAKERQQFFTALGEGVTNSKTFARLPEGLQEIVARATKDGPLENLYIPVESWGTYFQSAGIDPRVAAKEMLGSVTTYEEALRTGADLPIPTATYATKIAPTEHNAALSQELRVNPYDMNGREADAWFADYTKSEPETEPADSAAKVRDDVTGQLVGSGFDQHTAETYAGLYESTFRALGERVGRDPFELYSKYKLNIGRELPEVLRGIGKLDNLDVLLDRLRAGDMPKAKDVYGPSLLEFLRPLGLQDQGGELSARDLHKRRKFFERSLVRDDGLTLDHAAERAAEAGYIGERDPNVLLEAIDEELNGRARYAADRGDPALKERQAAADQLSEYLNQVGIDITQVDNETVKRLLMQESGPGAGTSAELYQAARVRIKDVVEQAAQPGNIQAKATIAPAPTWLVDAAAAAGMNIDGYKHVIDTSAVRHVLNRHGSPEAESARGNVAVTAADFEAIPQIVGEPDKVIFGTTNKGGRQQVIYLKSMPDGSTLYFEEVRTGRKDLAAVTLRKYPAAMNADSILSTLDLDVQGDGGDAVSIVDRPAVAKGPATDTPEFKRWFGQSKVVDENGKPLVVYHGTDTPLSVTRFKLRKEKNGVNAAYFTADPQIASAYAERMETTDYMTAPHVMPVYLSLQNPLVVDGEGRGWGYVNERALDDAKGGGHDGVIINNVIDSASSRTAYPATVYIAFRPEQIKSAIGNRGTFDPNDPNILFQSGADDRTLFIQHNLTESNLLHADKMGGLAVPSLAITTVDNPLTNFGEITLLGPSAMANPKGYARTNVFGADVYSPRYPTIHYRISAKAEKALIDKLEPYSDIGKSTYIDLDELQREGAKYLKHDTRVLAAFMDEAGIKVKIKKDADRWNVRVDMKKAIEKAGKNDDFDQYAERLFASLEPEERIFKGYTYSGKKSYQPHTLENVVKILKKELRGGESSANLYGIGQLRAKYTPKFRSLDGIRKEKGRIVGDEAFEKVKKEIEEEFFSLADSLAPYYKYDSKRFNFSDTVIAVLEDAPRGLNAALAQYDFVDVPSETKQEIAEFLEKLRTLPTEYFEAKILREVDLAEFRAAVVPDSVSDQAIKILERRGVTVTKYKKGDEDSRKKAIADAARSMDDVLFQKGDTKKGFIRIGSASMSIRLLEKADLSTFLHESGHFYLEVLGDLAQDQNAPAKLRADYQTILDWFGVTSREEITVEHHEQWARGFEAYLMEGKSPSPTLTAAFARFRAWLIGVYRSLKNLNVTLTPEVRAVMDRLVATDEEIDNAMKLSAMQPLFTDAEQSGMSPDEFAKYRADADEARTAAESELATKAMREYRRESERWWKDARTEVYKEVAAEVDQQQVQIALAALSRGTQPDGSPLPDGVQPVKLSRKGILDSFGADMLKRLPRPHVYTKEGGLHPDIAADLFGYRSGEELLLALARARPRKQLIEAETDVRMRERYGDMRLDGTMATDAMNAVHNEQRALLLRKELQHLATHHLPTLKKLVRKISHRVPTIEAVRTMAERAIASKRVRDISPALYERASAKASRNAVNAMLRGDFETAFAEKQRQLLNHELQRAAAAAREKVDGIVEHMGKFGKRSTREKLGRAGGDYLDQIDAILERFDFRKGVSIKAIERRKALAAWVTEQNETGFTVDMPARLLNEAYRQHYKDTSYEELVGIDDAVSTIEHLASLKNKLLANQRTRNLEDARADIVGSIGANHSLAPAPLDFAPGFKARTKEGAKGFAAAHSKPEFIFEWLDGNKPLGAVWQHLFKPFVDADATENKMMRDVSAGLAKIFQAYPRKERATWFFHRTFIPEINTSLTKANMLAVGLNWGNQYNRDALMRGYGWSEAQVKAVLDRLDARDWQTVQSIWDYIDSFWPQIEAREKELSGIAPGKVEATEVVTPHGTFRGGYYPIVFDSKLSWRQAVLEEKAHARDLFGGNWARAMTRHGHTVERTDTGGKPIRLELSGLTEHITNVVHDLAYRPALIDVGRLLNDKEIREAIEHSIGREYYRQLNPWLASMASDRRDYSNPIEGMLGRARAGATIVNMGWKLTTALTQILGFATSAKEIGIKYTALGIADSYSTPGKISEAWEFMTSRSEQMNSRLRNYDRDVRDSLKRLNVAGVKPGVGSVVDAYTNQIRDSFFTMIGYMDLAVSMPTWMGAYRKAMDGAVDNVAKGDEPAAIDYADQMIRETQGSGAAKDLALVQRGAESFRLFTMFYSYFSVLFNQFAKTTRQFRIDRNAPKLFASMALLWFIPAVLQDLMLGRGPDDDADEEEWTRWLLAREAAYPFQSMILVRDVINGMDQYGYEPSAAFDMYESLARTGSLGLKLAGGDKEEIERKDVKGLVMTAGYTLHLPTRQMWLTGEYFYDWLGGEVNPEHPAEAAWQGLVTGKPK